MDLIPDNQDPLNLTSEINAANRLSKNTVKREFLKSYLINKIPVLRANEESRAVVTKLARLNSDPNPKPNVQPNKGFKNHGVFFTSNQRGQQNQSNPNQNQAKAVKYFPCLIKCDKSSHA